MERKHIFTKITVAIFIISIMWLPLGCWDRIEVDNRAIVLGAAIDKGLEEGQYMVTAEIANPAMLISPLVGGGGGDDPPSYILTSTGWTIFDAMRNFTHQSSNKLSWEHNQVFIIGEEMAREGLAPVLDIIMRDWEIRRLSRIIIAKGKTGKEVLSVQPYKGGATGIQLEEQVRAQEFNSASIHIDFNRFVEMMLTPGESSVAGRVEIVDPGEPDGILSEEGSSSGGGEGESSGSEQEDSGSGSQEEPETLDMKTNLTEGEILRYSGGAIFKKDKLVGWLDTKQTRGYHWVMGEAVSGVIVVRAIEKGDSKISIRFTELISNIKPKLKNGEPMVELEIMVDGSVGEHMGTRRISDDAGLINMVEARTAEVVRNEIKAALAMAQHYKTDIFGFGKIFNREEHQWWKENSHRWDDEIFPQLEVEIDVEVYIRRPGFTNQPLVPN